MNNADPKYKETVISAITIATTVFLISGHLYGFSRSSGPSQTTMIYLSSECGVEFFNSACFFNGTFPSLRSLLSLESPLEAL